MTKLTVPLLILTAFSISQCSDNDKESEKKGCTFELADNYDPKAVIDDGSCEPVGCQKCTYTVKGNDMILDGVKLGLKPGDFICLSAKVKYTNLRFENLSGSADKPISIINCNGTATLDATGASYGIVVLQSKYVRIQGVGSGYGIQVSGGNMGIILSGLTTNVEVSGVEVLNSVTSGIRAGTEPTCDDATIRANFTMNDVSIHDNYIHDTGAEGLYVGSPYYSAGQEVTGCGTRLPHEIHGLDIYNNRIENAGWDGMQVSSATKDTEIYNNTIKRTGTAGETYQDTGILIGDGTTGACYSNTVAAPGNIAIMVYGTGDNLIYNNLVTDAGDVGIICYDSEELKNAAGYRILNNTIVSPHTDGILLSVKTVAGTKVINNLVVAPGSLNDYGNNTDRAYLNIYGNMTVESSNNYFNAAITEARFKDPAKGDYQLTAQSPAKDAGKDVSSLSVKTDLLGKPRPSGKAFDIGAYEYQ